MWQSSRRRRRCSKDSDGAGGALERVIRYCAAGLLVLLDVTRGDIAKTATAYAQAYLSADSCGSVDAITLSRYFWPETLARFTIEAEKAERGVVLLVRSRNSDSSIYQAADAAPGHSSWLLRRR